jgi:hypothetical protein
MSQPYVKGQSSYKAEQEPALVIRNLQHAVQHHSPASARAAQSASVARWLDEKPKQEPWNPVARMSNDRAAHKV